MPSATVAISIMAQHSSPMRTSVTNKPLASKRGTGRPVVGDNDVGRERILAAAEKLLRTLPPARVTVARVAQEANAHAKLINYYFGTRADLMVEVVDRITAHPRRALQPADDALEALSDNIAQTVHLVRRAPFLHRLINDELNKVANEASYLRVREMNVDLVKFYRDLVRLDDGKKLVDADPLFICITVLGACDFLFQAEKILGLTDQKGVNMKNLTNRFQEFLIKLVLDGLRNR